MAGGSAAGGQLLTEVAPYERFSSWFNGWLVGWRPAEGLRLRLGSYKAGVSDAAWCNVGLPARL